MAACGDELRHGLCWSNELYSCISKAMKIPQLLAFCFTLLQLSRAQGQGTLVANFDELPEGTVGSAFISGGILFYAWTFVGLDNVEFTPVGFVAPPAQVRRVKTHGPNIDFEIEGHVGRRVTLETSQHQDTWQTLITTNIPFPGTFTVSERRSEVGRFYRLLQDDCQ